MSLLSRPATIELLHKFGWLPQVTIVEALATVTDELLEHAKKLYGAYHGTNAQDYHLQLPRFCGYPDVMNQSATECKWPTGTSSPVKITYTVLDMVPGFTKAEYLACVAKAWGHWAAVCGINPVYEELNKSAMVIMDAKPIDGPGGILGQSELPCGPVQQLNQWFDTSEGWAIFDGPGSGDGKIDLCRVMTHEIGHILGMEHIGMGNLLAPIYNPSVFSPQAGDIQIVQSKYGPPNGGGLPVGESYTIQIFGKVGAITKVG